MKFWNPLRNFLLCEFLALSVGQLGLAIFALPHILLIPTAFTAGLGSFCGLWHWYWERRIPVLIFLLILGGTLVTTAYLMRDIAGGMLTGMILAFLVGLLSFRLTFQCQDSFYGPLGISALLASLLTVTVFQNRMFAVSSALCLLFSLDGFRERSLLQGYHMGRMGRSSEKDAALFRNSMELFLVSLSLLLLSASGIFLCGLGLLTALRWGYGRITGSAALHAAAAAINEQLEAFRLWLLSHFQAIGPEDGERMVETAKRHHFGTSSGNTMPILVILGVISLLAMLGGTCLAFMRPKRKKENVLDYVDEVENLERPENFLRRWLEQRKKQKFSDLTDNNLKIRFVFQQLMRRRQTDIPNVITKTPREIVNQDQPLEQDLLEAYHRVRYQGKNATEKDVSAAEQLLLSMGK